MVTICGAQLVTYLDPERGVPTLKLFDKAGKVIDVPNPTYEIDRARDSQVLSFLFNSISPPVMVQIASCTTASAAWIVITEIFISQTQAAIVNTRIALSTTKKGNSTIAEYLGRMKALGDEMAAIGKPLTDDDMVSYILAGLDFDYISFVSSVCARTVPVKPNELYAQHQLREPPRHVRGWQLVVSLLRQRCFPWRWWFPSWRRLRQERRRP
ncbi:uncharacterized protein [Triticum aestivum]|uniref:uncharacterized protein n=1 Tax=Triticum aestivum TaxID=4565 RepID=UPI001D0259F4|nr:uncharacterized protein LOC123186289 [Triticum aestivum]